MRTKRAPGRPRRQDDAGGKAHTHQTFQGDLQVEIALNHSQRHIADGTRANDRDLRQPRSLWSRTTGRACSDSGLTSISGGGADPPGACSASPGSRCMARWSEPGGSAICGGPILIHEYDPNWTAVGETSSGSPVTRSSSSPTRTGRAAARCRRCERWRWLLGERHRLVELDEQHRLSAIANKARCKTRHSSSTANTRTAASPIRRSTTTRRRSATNQNAPSATHCAF